MEDHAAEDHLTQRGKNHWEWEELGIDVCFPTSYRRSFLGCPPWPLPVCVLTVNSLSSLSFLPWALQPLLGCVSLPPLSFHPPIIRAGPLLESSLTSPSFWQTTVPVSQQCSSHLHCHMHVNIPCFSILISLSWFRLLIILPWALTLVSIDFCFLSLVSACCKAFSIFCPIRYPKKRLWSWHSFRKTLSYLFSYWLQNIAMMLNSLSKPFSVASQTL